MGRRCEPALPKTSLGCDDDSGCNCSLGHVNLGKYVDDSDGGGPSNGSIGVAAAAIAGGGGVGRGAVAGDAIILGGGMS